MSFLLDPPLLVASGAAIERLLDEAAPARCLRTGTLTTFVTVSLALYANAPGLSVIWGPFGCRSGREFMLTSGLGHIDEDGITARHHICALSLFALYPLWLRLGAAAVRR